MSEEPKIDAQGVTTAASRIVELLGGCSFKGEDAEKILQIRQLAVAIINEAQKGTQLEPPRLPEKEGA